MNWISVLLLLALPIQALYISPFLSLDCTELQKGYFYCEKYTFEDDAKIRRINAGRDYTVRYLVNNQPKDTLKTFVLTFYSI